MDSSDSDSADDELVKDRKDRPKQPLGRAPATKTRRFVSKTAAELDKLEKAKNGKNTVRATSWAMNVFNEWLDNTDKKINLQDITKPDLINILREFYGSIRTAKGELYGISSYASIRAGINRYLNEPPVSRSWNIMQDSEFTPANNVFKGVIKEIRRAGQDKSTHHPPITPDDHQLIYNSNTLSPDHPKGLLNKVWFDIQLHFGRRGKEGNRELKADSFVLKTDEYGLKYFTMNEDTKNHKDPQERDRENRRGAMFELPNDPLCPVRSMEKYLSKLPPNPKAFYLQAKRGSLDHHADIWFNNVSVGVNQMSSWLSRICKEVGCQIYTNQSLSVTAIQKLADAGLEAREIMAVSGHKCESSLKSYWERRKRWSATVDFRKDRTPTSQKHDSSTSEKSSSSIQTHVSEKRSSSGVHSKDVSFSEHMDLSVLEDVCVNLGCLLQLFQLCERCRSVCTVSAQGDREHFSVLAWCKDCSQYTTWSSQPVRVSDELGNPPDQGKEHMEPPESLTTTSTASNRLKGTGLNKPQGKADDQKTEKLFVEVDVTIDSDGEQSADEDVFAGLEEEEEEEMEGLGIEEEETEGEKMEDGQREEGETKNGEIENVDNGQLLGISWPESEDWQTEVEKQEEMEEEEEEEAQIDEDDEDWEAEEEEDGLDSDFDSDSDSEEKKKKKKKGNVEGSRRPRGTPRRANEQRDRRTPRLCPDCGVIYTTYTHKCYDKGTFLVCSDEEQSHSLTEKDPYLCSECPQRFRSIKERILHFKEHKKIFCQTCHKRFPKGLLKRHMLSHSSDKPYKCKVCGRAFAQASQLKCHTRVHTGERPYKCQLCPLSFNLNIGLKNHVRRHHQEEQQDDPDTDSLVTTAKGGK